jgi:hypothetical protein
MTNRVQKTASSTSVEKIAFI